MKQKWLVAKLVIRIRLTFYFYFLILSYNVNVCAVCISFALCPSSSSPLTLILTFSLSTLRTTNGKSKRILCYISDVSASFDGEYINVCTGEMWKGHVSIIIIYSNINNSPMSTISSKSFCRVWLTELKYISYWPISTKSKNKKYTVVTVQQK